jgi:phosphatidylserine/phosphatidylglycerophosphate/cardiolipin synthase-like enzyme
VPLRAIPGEPDLMHHKYVVRDAGAVWTGSTNWTLDSWTRMENLVVRIEDPAIAGVYERNFGELWRRREVDGTGAFDAPVANGVRPWFCPGRGEELGERIGAAIARAKRRVRIASPVITAGPVLNALDRAQTDVSGVVDATQLDQVFAQWATQPQVAWKIPLLRRAMERHGFSGKRSTPYAPDTVHDFMHAKVAVCDDVVFTGSFNLSRSGEENAENVLEIHDAALAERLAGWIDELTARYAP